MSLCKANKAVSDEVKNFMLNVPDVKEESITDYLVWKWRELDARFKFINVSTFTRHEESKTSGADFELELWLVGSRFHFPLIFQAKKFVRQHGSYFNKLNYPAGTQAQLKMLLAYAKTKNRLPFYAFYSVPDAKTRSMCRGHDPSNTGIFMADAYTIKTFADGLHGKRISKNDLLKVSNPFHCMFCCPLVQLGDYFTSYFSSLSNAAQPRENEHLPEYVNMILNEQRSEVSEQETLPIINKYGLRAFRAVGVYDMRNADEELNQSFNQGVLKHAP